MYRARTVYWSREKSDKQIYAPKKRNKNKTAANNSNNRFTLFAVSLTTPRANSHRKYRITDRSVRLLQHLRLYHFT